MSRNTELLERVMQHIEDHPEQHQQAIWANECGTAACFAGWAALFSGWTREENNFFRSSDGRSLHLRSLASEVLGLSDGESEILFHAANHVELLRMMVKDISNGDRLTDGWEYHGSGPTPRDERGTRKRNQSVPS